MEILKVLSIMAAAAAYPTMDNKCALVEQFKNPVLGAYASDLYDEIETGASCDEVLKTLENAAYIARMENNE